MCTKMRKNLFYRFVSYKTCMFDWKDTDFYVIITIDNLGGLYGK